MGYKSCEGHSTKGIKKAIPKVTYSMKGNFHQNVNSLNLKLIKEWTNFPDLILRIAINDVQTRQKACIKGKHGYFDI